MIVETTSRIGIHSLHVGSVFRPHHLVMIDADFMTTLIKKTMFPGEKKIGWMEGTGQMEGTE